MRSGIDAQPGDRGGHVYWEKNGSVTLPAGIYTITAHHENVTYPSTKPDGSPSNFDPKYNDSKCVFSITATKEPKSLKLLTADEYGEIQPTGTDCKAYNKSGDKVVGGHHAISMALEYSDSTSPSDFNETPSSSVASDAFKPTSLSLDAEGKARFKVWTKANTGTPSVVTLNGAVSPEVSYLPAVFEDLFKVTVYYTIKESGCSGTKTSILCTVDDSTATTTVSVKEDFMRRVRIEGFGVMDTPYVDANGNEYPYFAKSGSGWKVYDRILGNKNNTLIDKKYCAAHGDVLKHGSRIQIALGDELFAAFGGDTFEVGDVGGGVNGNHIDLYWGCDDPSAADPYIPAGLANGIAGGEIFRVILLEE